MFGQSGTDAQSVNRPPVAWQPHSTMWPARLPAASRSKSSARQPNSCISGPRTSALSTTRPVTTMSAPAASARCDRQRAEVGVGAGDARRQRRAVVHVAHAARREFRHERGDIVAFDHGDPQRQAGRRDQRLERRRAGARVDAAGVAHDLDAARRDLAQHRAASRPRRSRSRSRARRSSCAPRRGSPSSSRPGSRRRGSRSRPRRRAAARRRGCRPRTPRRRRCARSCPSSWRRLPLRRARKRSNLRDAVVQRSAGR